MTPVAVLEIDEMTASVRDVKQAQAELARVLKEYIDARVEYEIAVAANDPDYTGYHERERLAGAEIKLSSVISRAD